MVDSYDSFVSQLEGICQIYPHLRVKSQDGKKYLKGTLDIKNSEQITVQSFLIEIHYSKKFPYRFPKLFEVGNDIPCEADWHKYNDNSCCITVEPDEIIQCKNGLSLKGFIELNVIPYFANQTHKIMTGKYKNEYPHGKSGMFVYYSELFKSQIISEWILYLQYAFGMKPLKIGRNDKCICGSSIKMKKCHLEVFKKLQLIGKENIINHLKQFQ